MLVRLCLIVALSFFLLDFSRACNIQVSSLPTTIFVTSDFIIIMCTYDNSYFFDSFFHPSYGTLTSTHGRYAIVTESGRAKLKITSLEEADEGIYSCSAKNSQQQPCNEQVNIIFNDHITFLTPNGLTYHTENEAIVTIVCDVLHYNELRWQKGNNNIPQNSRISVVGRNLHFDRVLLEDEGTYLCVAESQYESSKSITANLRVYLKPSVTITPQATVVNISDTANFTCLAKGYPRPTIVWAREETEGPGLTLQQGVVEKKEEVVDGTTVRSMLTFFRVRETDTGTYRCTVYNINSSSSAIASLQQFGTPGPPQITGLEVINLTNIRVAWQPPLDDGHLDILQYTIMWFSKSDLSDLKSYTADGASRQYIIANLNPVTMYTITVYAKNSNGRGKGSDEANISTNATTPAAPVSISIQDITASSVRVIYTVSNDDGGATVTSLRFSVQTTNGLPSLRYTKVKIPPVTQHYVLDRLEGDSTYAMEISSGNLIGFGPSLSTSFKTLRPGYPGSPKSVRVLRIGTLNAVLEWEIGSTGKPFIKYDITASVNGSTANENTFSVKANEVKPVNDTHEQVEVSGLSPKTCYTFTITVSNSEGEGWPSQPSSIACTLSCLEGSCEQVSGVQSSNDLGSSKLVPILVVTIVVAIVIILVLIVVIILTAKYTRHRKYTVKAHNQNFSNMSMSSSHSSSLPSHSLAYYSSQHSHTSSSTDVEESPQTGSTTASENPFVFSTAYQSGPAVHSIPNQNASVVYSSPNSSGTNVYNSPYPSGTVQFDSTSDRGVKTTGSYSLFPIPEHSVATIATAHFPASTPALLQTGSGIRTCMTENPAYENERVYTSSTLDDPVDETPPPVPPYCGDAMSDTESNLPPPPVHVHPHFHHRAHMSGHLHNSNSVPILGESFSQTSHSPGLSRADFYLPGTEEGEELEVVGEEGEEGGEEMEFMENNAYESVTPETIRKEYRSHSQPNFESSSLPQHEQGSLSLSRQGTSPTSVASGPPKFEIASQERGLVFETVKIRNR